MARTKKTKSVEEQLEKVICDIKTTQENLKKLRKMKRELEKELENEKRINNLDRLDKVIDSEGISYEEAERRLRQTSDKI